MPQPVFHAYPDGAALAEALASGVAAVLAGGIATRGLATLAVSGGSTPKRFFEALSEADIEWANVVVTLVDERWVPETSDRANAGLVRRHLLKGRAAAARFEPLYAEGGIEEAFRDVCERIRLLPHPFDALVLGMGTDGHTASFFPDAEELDTLIDPPPHPAPISIIHAASAGEPRMTLTLPPIVEARFLALHIEGQAKRDVYETALGEGATRDLPIRSVLRAPRPEPVAVFWAP